MRSLLSAFALLCSLLGPATAFSALPEWEPGGTLSFRTGSSYNLTLAFPALPDWDSLTLDIALPTTVFEPLTSGAFSTGYSVDSGVGVSNLGSSMSHPGLNAYQILLILAEPTSVDAGSLVLTMALKVKPALDAQLLGNHQVFTDLEYTTFSMVDDNVGTASLVINANIAAIPEPEAWAMMMAGLWLVAAATVRHRQRV